MKKKTFRKLLISFCAAVSFIALGGAIGLQKDSAVAVAETATATLPATVTGTATEDVVGEVELESFAMRQGGSVRIVEPAGLRFMTYINRVDLEKLPDNAKFGTLVLPTSMLNGELTLETSGAAKGEITKWSAYSTEFIYKFNSVLKFDSEKAQKFYGRAMTARSYVTYTDKDGNTYTIYADYAQSRSMAYLASCDIADGYEEQLLFDICNSVVNGELKWEQQCTALKVGQSVQLLHNAKDSDGVYLAAKYQVEGDCVSVDKNGVITALSAGEATVTATVGSYSVTTEIVVQADVRELLFGQSLYHDFDTNMDLGKEFQGSALDYSTIIDGATTTDALSGKSLLLNTAEGEYPTVKFMTEPMLFANGQYKVTFEYKVLTEKMPSYFCVGFNGMVQVNRENWFSGRTDTVGQTYTFEYTFDLTEGIYYFQVFNYQVEDAAIESSKIVIDDIVIKNVTQDTQTLADLDAAGGKITHDFDGKTVFGEYVASNADNVTVSATNGISLNSLTINNTDANPSVIFFSNNRLSLHGQYKVSFDYKVLTESLPSYFCVGFKKNDTSQINRENWFSGRNDVKDTVYTFEHTFEISGNDYYLQIFNLNADGSKIVIDNITIENVSQKLSALQTVGNVIKQDFDTYTVLGDFESSYLSGSYITTEKAVSGNSLLLDNSDSAVTVKWLTDNKMHLSGTYKVTFDYIVLTDNAPNYFCVGFNGTQQVCATDWFENGAALSGQFEYMCTLEDGYYYLQIYNLNQDSSQIVIDNITIEKIN